MSRPPGSRRVTVARTITRPSRRPASRAAITDLDRRYRRAPTEASAPGRMRPQSHQEEFGTISSAEALPSDHEGTPSERSVIIYESTNGGRKPGKNAIHPHR